jgi:hypothetical protein
MNYIPNSQSCFFLFLMIHEELHSIILDLGLFRLFLKIFIIISILPLNIDIKLMEIVLKKSLKL